MDDIPVDSPVGNADIVSLARLLLSQLQRADMNVLNNVENIDLCHNVLTEAVSILRQQKNRRTAFLSLPDEVLRYILSWIPETLRGRSIEGHVFAPMWTTAAVDCTMLIPISQTCRYLRELSLTDQLLWRTIVTDSEFIPSTIISRSGPKASLTVVIHPSKDFVDLLDCFYSSRAHQVEELQLLGIGHRHIKFLGALLDIGNPALISYGVTGRPGSLYKWETNTLPISSSAAMSLQTLHIEGVPLLPAIALPQLTHLALCNIQMSRGMHGTIAAVLQRCPNLQALVLTRLSYEHDASYDPDSQDARPLTHHNLRRVTFRSLGPYLAYFLDQLPGHKGRPSIQVFDQQFDLAGSIVAFASLFHQHLLDSDSHLLISFATPQTSSMSDVCTVSFTAVGSTTVAHIASCVTHPRLFADSADSNDSILRTGVATLLLGAPPTCRPNVKEVRVHCTSKSYTIHSSIYKLAETLSALPLLETIVLTYDCHAKYGQGPVLQPDLRACPDARKSQASGSPLLKTLCLCFFDGPGYTKSYVRKAVRFTTMLRQLENGAYDYFEHLVVRVVPHFVPDEGDLRELRARFASVRVERVRGAPGLALPESCIETRVGASGHRQLWEGVLW